MNAVASVALLATLATACTMPRSGATTVTVLGAATTLTGVIVAGGGDVDSDMDGVNENPLNDDWGQALGGGVLVLAGLGLIVAAVSSRPPPDENPAFVAHPRPRAASLAWSPDVMPYDYVPGDPPGKTIAAPLPPPRATLPEIATDDVTLRMAQQTRSAVERGDCDAAWSTWAAIHERDERYAAALAVGPVLAPCPPRPVAIDQ